MSEEINNTEENDQEMPNQDQQSNTIALSGLYENWFLDYASYVILDRAVPHINDGFKPVQRRILHSLKEMDDGRYNKAANVIGNTMKYHPHGDASIGDAMVQLGQKDLLIDCQGNWGDPITGDSAAAPRYIEGRLSKFGNEVVFNPDTTEWQLSYDGRNKEPVTLPVKFPLLLTQGAEGIAVGLATKIMPHNFVELIDGSIQVLKGERPAIYPDFPTAGMADVSAYNEGQRGGKIRVRAKIEERDKKTLAITEIPFSTTTGSLIDSIVNANEKGKIKIKKIEDNTAEFVEIMVHLAPGISPDVTIDALYAFTACETSISPNTCVIKKNKPHFMSVNDILIENTKQTKSLLKLELEIRLHELQEKIFFSSLLKIFIQQGMYKHAEYENAGDFEVVVAVLDKLFTPFFEQFYRPITSEDYKKLIDKPMSSITRFDVKKADDLMSTLENEIKEVKKNLRNLTEYAIKWFEYIRGKYAKGRERKTELRLFDKVEATQVALANEKLYVNRQEGFIGKNMRKDEFVCDCSDIDDIIVFRSDGKYSVVKIQDKVFVGKDIIHVAVFKKGDDRTVYNAIYKDGATGTSYLKRFSVTGVTRDKDYDIGKGSKGTKMLYFTANSNGEAEVVNIQLKPHSKLRKLTFDLDFAEVAIKGRGSQGNIVSKYPLKKVTFKHAGVSTLAGRKIWYDDILKRLNADERGRYLGEFDGDHKILIVLNDGSYELSNFDLNHHFDEKMIRMEKYIPKVVYTAIHQDSKGTYYVKRFTFEDNPVDKRVKFIPEDSKLILLSNHPEARVEVNILKGKSQTREKYDQLLLDIVDVKGMKAQGNRLSFHMVQKVSIQTQELNLANFAEGQEVKEVLTPDTKQEQETAIAQEIAAETAIEVESTPEPTVQKTEITKSPIKNYQKKESSEKETEKETQKETKKEEEVDKQEKQPPIKDEFPLEITNPDDIQVDDNGQLGLFGKPKKEN